MPAPRISPRAARPPLLGALLLGLSLPACSDGADPVSAASTPPSASTPPAAAPPAATQPGLAPGLVLEVWAEDVRDARSLALGPQGHVFVGSRRGDAVRALRDSNGDGRADQRITIAEKLTMPNGIAVRGDDLYVATNGAVLRFPGRAADPAGEGAPQRIRSLPTERHHGWRYLDVDPQGRLVVAIGAPCNVCDRPDFATLERFDAQGGNVEVIAHGVRNSVGFDWDAQGRLWFTDNGRDWLGDDSPPDEINRMDREGAHYGFPWCHGGDVPDPDFDERACADFVPPAQRLGAHVAALGIHFYSGDMLRDYRGGAFVAEHGSWNRSEKAGYRVMYAQIEQGQVRDYRPVVDVWLDGQEVSGRPVDLLTLPDGSLLISDDHGDRIWRLRAAGE